MIRVSFEGIDGSGKSIQAKMFNDYLIKQGKDALFFHEPRILRKEIFEVVKQVKEGKVTDAYLSYMFGKDGWYCRFDEVSKTTAYGIEFQNVKGMKNYSAGVQKEVDYLIRDRDTTISQYAYHHGFGTSDEMNYLMSWMINQINGVDVIIFVNVPVEVALKRITSRANEGEKLQQEYFEKEEKLRQVHSNYLELFSDGEKCKLMSIDNAEILIVDGTEPIEKVHENIVKGLKL